MAQTTDPCSALKRACGPPPKRAAARSTRTSLAPAAARRSASPASGIDRLPNVPGSWGHRSVSPWTIRTAAGSTASSSATSSRNAVRLSCPTSTLPVKAVTVPDAATCSHAPPARGQAAAAAGGHTTTSPLPSTPNQSRSPGADMSHGRAGRASEGPSEDAIAIAADPVSGPPRRGPGRRPGAPRGRSSGSSRTGTGRGSAPRRSARRPDRGARPAEPRRAARCPACSTRTATLVRRSVRAEPGATARPPRQPGPRSW